jgi:hypothetical protein
MMAQRAWPLGSDCVQLAARPVPLTERVPLRQRRMLAGSLICGLRGIHALPGVVSLGPPPEFR